MPAHWTTPAAAVWTGLRHEVRTSIHQIWTMRAMGLRSFRDREQHQRKNNHLSVTQVIGNSTTRLIVRSAKVVEISTNITTMETIELLTTTRLHDGRQCPPFCQSTEEDSTQRDWRPFYQGVLVMVAGGIAQCGLNIDCTLADECLRKFRVSSLFHDSIILWISHFPPVRCILSSLALLVLIALVVG